MKNTVFVFMQLITVTFCSRGRCQSGLLWHQDVSKCCRHITHCGPDHQVKPCKADGGQDYCAPCPEGEKNYFNTSSFDMKACRTEICQDAKIFMNGKCECNRLEGEYGHRHCLNNGKLCPKSMELTQYGKCKKCSVGYYKDWEGHGFCKKQIDCDLLQLEYKERGTNQKEAICQIRQTVTKKPGTQNPLVDITEKSVVDLITEGAVKSESSKSSSSSKKTLLTCDLQIIIVVLGVLLFLSSLLIVYLICAKKIKKVTKSTRASEVGSFKNRPLPILPRQRTYSTPEDDQYIPMNGSRHPSCSKSIRQDYIQQQSVQEIHDNWVGPDPDPYAISSSPSEETYVRIST